MKNFIKTHLSLAVALIALLSCESTQTTDPSETIAEQSYLPLIETFETNDLKWIQENTEHHFLEVDNGVYLIQAKDSTRQTSTAPYINDYLSELNEKFSVKINFNMLHRDVDFWSRAGLMITCASKEYKAFISNERKVIVTEHDYNDEGEFIIFEDVIEEDVMNQEIELELQIDGYKGEVLINEFGLGDFELQSKSVDGIRIFTSALTSIEVYEFSVTNL